MKEPRTQVALRDGMDAVLLFLQVSSLQDPDICRSMRAVIAELLLSGIPTLVVVTHIDTVPDCDLQSISEEIASQLHIPLGWIHLMKNYTWATPARSFNIDKIFSCFMTL